MGAVVEALLTARAAGEPMEAPEAVTLIAGVGIAGDRYATNRGHWSDPQWPDREVTLIESELLDDLGLAPRDLRRNIVTRGVVLAALIGREFAIGKARLLGVRPCDPCQYLESLGRPGLFRALAGRGGLRARIVQGGDIRLGDAIVPASDH